MSSEAAARAPITAGRDRGLVAAIGLTGTATLLTVVLGVGTTKIIALVAGPAGIALMGLYRNLGALVNRSLLLGLDTTVVQRISTAKDRETVSDTVGAALLALVLQGVVIAAAGLGLAGLIGRWLFGGAPSQAQLLDVKVVLAMAYANLVLQVMTALLSGRVEIRKVAGVGVVAAVVTLVVIYPLLQLGHVGLALNVGSGSTIGAALATFFAWRTYRPYWVRRRLTARFAELTSMISRSAFLILQPLVIMAAIVWVQALVLRHFTLVGLGAYNASTTIVDTTVMLIMASARTFFLPALGQLENPDHKAEVVNRVLRLNLLMASVAALILIVGATLWIPMLFSGRFEQAIDILPRLSVALVGQALVWSYAMFYLSQARYRLFFCLDLIWALVYLGATFVVTVSVDSLVATAWAYAGSYLLSGILYTLVAVRAFGARMLTGSNLRLSALAISGALLACLLHTLGLWLIDLAVLVVGLGACGRALLRTLAAARASELA